VTERPHYINGRLNQPGEVVTLPAGVSPGRFLELVDEAAPEAPPKNKGGRPRKNAAQAA